MKKMTLSLFLGEFHTGLLNRLLHVVGFIILTIGIWRHSIALIIISMITQEMGHLYQHLVVEKGKVQFRTADIMKWQTLLGGVAFIVYAILILGIKYSIYGNF